MSLSVNFIIGQILSFHVIRCHFMSYDVIKCHIISLRVISCDQVSYHVITCHIMSLGVISCHRMSYNIILCLFLPAFNKVGRGQGGREGQIFLPRPSATASLSGAKSKNEWALKRFFLRVRFIIFSFFSHLKLHKLWNVESECK
jgi:hypothetical protein